MQGNTTTSSLWCGRPPRKILMMDLNISQAWTRPALIWFFVCQFLEYALGMIFRPKKPDLKEEFSAKDRLCMINYMVAGFNAVVMFVLSASYLYPRLSTSNPYLINIDRVVGNTEDEM